MGLYQGFCKLSGLFISGSCPETPSPSFCHCIHAKSPLWCRFLVSREWVLVRAVLLSFCLPGSSTSSPFSRPFRPSLLEYFGLSPLIFRRGFLLRLTPIFSLSEFGKCLFCMKNQWNLFLSIHKLQPNFVLTYSRYSISFYILTVLFTFNNLTGADDLR